jgi:hypothetical protein
MRTSGLRKAAPELFRISEPLRYANRLVSVVWFVGYPILEPNKQRDHAPGANGLLAILDSASGRE